MDRKTTIFSNPRLAVEAVRHSYIRTRRVKPITSPASTKTELGMLLRVIIYFDILAERYTRD